MKLQLLGLKDLNIVQIRIVNTDEDFESLPNSAKYLDSSVFSIFRYCFELSKPDFKYASKNLFTKNQVVTLRNHLLTHSTRISNLMNEEDLQAFILHQISGLEFMNELKTMCNNWRSEWESIREKLVAVNKDLIEIVDICIDEDKELYIKGY